ncbi:hypothetical protein EDB92DRAFT_1820769 [Lactarius akahatsu]|uniref:Uncharacterized protein n=1 Tax=Lactarius akahatsu TaxID=416441 RepID=A0AAD4Q310_9AGAM|nr:hypothetical protein EDB92DRAFT_1820769 [Lactarius akahatsu]
MPAAPPMLPPAVTMPPCQPRSPSYRSCASRGASPRPYHRPPPMPPPPPPILLVIAFEPIAPTRRPSRTHDESPHAYAPAYHGASVVGGQGILLPIGVGFPAATWSLLELLFGVISDPVPNLNETRRGSG